MCPAPWAHSSPALRGAATLTDAHVVQWQTHGYAVVEGVFPAELIAAEVEEARASFPEPSPDMVLEHGTSCDFPFATPARNDVALHPRLLRAVAQLLGTEALRLSECQQWSKYGDYSSPQPYGELAEGQSVDEVMQTGEQGHHLDYGNGTLVVPVAQEAFREEVAIIVYLDEVSEVGGSTAVVSRQHSESATELRTSALHGGLGSKQTNPELYEGEVQVKYSPGTVLFYRFDTFHRGTPVRANRVRRCHSIVYRREDCHHVQWDVWAKHLGPLWVGLVPQLSVWQRNVLGFPKPGDRYWATPQATALVEDRYPGIDLELYRHAAAAVGGVGEGEGAGSAGARL